jgi:hypothetical protein
MTEWSMGKAPDPAGGSGPDPEIFRIADHYKFKKNFLCIKNGGYYLTWRALSLSIKRCRSEYFSTGSLPPAGSVFTCYFVEVNLILIFETNRIEKGYKPYSCRNGHGSIALQGFEWRLTGCLKGIAGLHPR